MSFSVLKAGVRGCLLSKVPKSFSKGITNIGADTTEFCQLRTMGAVLSANITATTPVQTGKAFAVASINFINDKIQAEAQGSH